MERIQAQANKLWQVISSPSTAKVYQQTLALTWSILKETGQLLWLVLCLGLVAGDWFWKKSYKVGQDTRVWVNTMQTKVETPAGEGADPGSTANFLGETSKSLLAAGQAGVTLALNTAKAQLGLEVESEPLTPLAPVATPPAPSVAVASSPEPTATPTATPSQAIAPTEVTSVSPTQTLEDE